MENFNVVKKELNDKLLNKVMSFLPKLDLVNGPWLAGGSVRKMWFDEPWERHDLDFFFRNQFQYESFSKSFETYLSVQKKQNSYQVYRTRNANTYTITGNLINPDVYHELRIQFITREFYNDYKHLWDDFDFNICNFVTDSKIIVADECAIENCEKKILDFNTPRRRTLDARRVIKYGFYGFDSKPDILKEVLNQHFDGILTENWSSDY